MTTKDDSERYEATEEVNFSAPGISGWKTISRSGLQTVVLRGEDGTMTRWTKQGFDDNTPWIKEEVA